MYRSNISLTKNTMAEIIWQIMCHDVVDIQWYIMLMYHCIYIYLHWLLLLYPWINAFVWIDESVLYIFS